MERKKYIVFRAIFDQYDILEEIPSKAFEPDLFDYVCFTNDKIHSSTWEIKTVQSRNVPALDNRFYKIMIDSVTASRYAGSIYVDGNVRIKDKLSELINPGVDLTIYDHIRNCIYEEAQTVIQKGKDSRERVEPWVRNLESEGYPKENGLFWNGILIRNHTAEMNALSREWWRLLNLYSYRDQLTLPYLIWKYEINVNCLHRTLDKKGVFCNKYFYYNGKHSTRPLWRRVFALFSSKKSRDSEFV